MRKGMSNLAAAIIVAVIGVAMIGGIIWAAVSKKASEPDFSQYNVNTVIAASEENGNIGDHVKGNPDAPVLIFEYADYQCSACAVANPRINKLVDEYGDKLGVVYRDFLLSYHQNGTAAASAAEAAGLQGYWKEYANKLFTNQSVWANASGDARTDVFVELFRSATNGEGDETKFVQDMKSEAVKKKINFDAGISKNLDIPGTPAFFIDGERIDFSNAKNEEEFLNIFREKIDAKLNKITN
ncbi:thioredoxin domain-containing protein [Candidatus Saccharibacteria bacterium]|nr:thioredoxin domain-containing protein [Candidatus Saccharibacteria bacterium]